VLADGSECALGAENRPLVAPSRPFVAQGGAVGVGGRFRRPGAAAYSRPMASQASNPTSRGTRDRAGARPRVDPARKMLGGAVLMVVVGSFMPWVDTAVGEIIGARGAGLWTFYAAMLGLAGALVPSRRIAGVQGAVLAAAAIGLPVWQVVHLLNLVGFEGWMPGPGLVLVLGGGVLSGVAATRLLRNA